MPEVRWQGAAEVRAEGAVRVGSLYVVDEVLYFVDGGRTDKRVKPHSAFFATAAALATAPATIEAYVYLWVPGGPGAAARIAQVVAALATFALAGAGLWSRARLREADEAAMKALADMKDVPDFDFLDSWSVEDGGSFRLPIADIETCEVDGEDGLRIVTRLLDRYGLTVIPDRDRLRALLT